MNTPQLREVLDELYALDPTLRTQEEELIPVLEKLLKRKPDTEPDPAFVQKLRVLLRDKAAEGPAPSSFFSFLTMPTFNYAITGAVLGAIITGPVVYGIMSSGGIPAFPTDGTREQALFSYSVEDTGSRAFGELANGNVDTYGMRGGSPSPEMAMNSRPQSGGGGDAAVTMDGDQKMMIAPEMTEYTLKFDGELPALTAEQIDVFKRQKGISSADVSTILGAFDTGLVDLTSFGGAKADNISFYQDTQYGYMVNVSFREGVISMNANWEKWPHPESSCMDEACYQRYRIKIGDIPADETILSIADDFIDAHNVDLSQYGEPEVDNMWRVNYEAADNKADYYLPEISRVIYPQLVDGKPVYDESGAKSGISVGVNVREKKVSDVWGIMDQKYLKSAYPAVTDISLITAYLENFGKMPEGWMPEGTTVTKAEITLGTPEIAFVKHYTYENNVSDELIIPALVFPVTNVPAGTYFYRNSITVPLAADILEKMTSQSDGGGMPRPMPIDVMMREEAALPATDDAQE